MKKLSQQHLWQIEQQKKNLCVKCAKPKVTALYCLKHAIWYRKYQRKYQKSKKHYNCLTKRLQNSL